MNIVNFFGLLIIFAVVAAAVLLWRELRKKPMSRSQSYLLWYRAFLVLGVLGVVNIATKKHTSGFGIISLGATLSFGGIFGARAAAVIGVFTGAIFDFAILWFIVAYLLHQRIKSLQKKEGGR